MLALDLVCGEPILKLTGREAYTDWQWIRGHACTSQEFRSQRADGIVLGVQHNQDRIDIGNALGDPDVLLDTASNHQIAAASRIQGRIREPHSLASHPADLAHRNKAALQNERKGFDLAEALDNLGNESRHAAWLAAIG